MPDHLLFSYGTLQLPRVQTARFGRELDGTPDALPGFRLDAAGDDTHQAAVRSGAPDDAVEGTVFTLSPADLAAADEFEVGYLRVPVALRSGAKAWVYVETATAEDFRVRQLLDAQANAVALFDEVVARKLIAPGESERAISDRIRDLANEMFGTTRHWHKRIVRSGPNTLLPYDDNTPDRILRHDDIAFADFGPIFADFEADLGRTYVLGDDPAKHRLAADLPRVFEAGRRHFADHPAITGADLHAEIDALARAAGWRLGGTGFAGHLVGEFPHEVMDADKIQSYIAPGNTTPMRGTDRAGRVCHWILEIHLVDPAGEFGGFYEQLLDLG